MKKEENQDLTPFDEGNHDQQKDIKLRDNPYSAGTIRSSQYIAGWMDE